MLVRLEIAVPRQRHPVSMSVLVRPENIVVGGSSIEVDMGWSRGLGAIGGTGRTPLLQPRRSVRLGPPGPAHARRQAHLPVHRRRRRHAASHRARHDRLNQGRRELRRGREPPLHDRIRRLSATPRSPGKRNSRAGSRAPRPRPSTLPSTLPRRSRSGSTSLPSTSATPLTLTQPRPRLARRS